MTRRFRAVLLCALAALAIPATGEAQGIKDLIKKKAKEAARSEEKAPPDTEASITFNSDLIEITDPVLDDFTTGLKVEIAARDQLKREVAAYPTRVEKWRTCSHQAMMSPEGMKISMKVGELPEGATAEQLQKVLEKAHVEMQALLSKKCGKEPNEQPDVYKGTQAAELAGADAFDRAQAARSSRAQGPAVGDEFWAYPPIGSAMGSIAYALLKERIRTFCQALEEGLIKVPTDPVDAAATAATTVNNKLVDILLQGHGPKMYWRWKGAEGRAIAPRCEAIMAFLVLVM